MNKKILSLLLIFTLVLSSFTVASAEGGEFDPETAEANMVRVEGSKALAALEDGTGIIIDVRANEVHDANGYVEGAIHQPLFTYDGKNNVTNREDALATAFTDLINDNAKWEGKDIFVLCNSGSKGAAAATYLLVKAGISSTRVFTIQGGAGSADIQAVLKRDYNFKTGAEALEAQKSGAVILDVRSAANHGKYTVAGSISAPLFGADGAISAENGELATEFTAFVKGNADLAGKDIYVLCNSGSRGAQLATKLLLLAGYPAEKINTITNGAKDLAILDAAIGNGGDSWNNGYQNFVAGKDAVAAVGNSNIVFLDVRATEVREKNGFLNGSIGQPLFTVEGGSNKVTALDGELAKNFAAFVRGNKTAWSGKEIYILCNGGQSGARAALKLLLSEGFNYDNIKVIKGGASDADVQAAFTYDYQYASGEKALADTNGVIIDVRSTANFGKYSLKNSTNVPLFDASNKLPDDLADAFTAYAKSEEGLAALTGKNIYIVCNSGARGAQKATALLIKAGYSNKNIYTITNGAKDLDFLDAAIGNDKDTWNKEYKNFVSGKDAVAAAGKENVVILDVRATETRKANGEIKGSVAQPLFVVKDGKNVVSTLKDDLAADFTKFVKGNKDLAGKEIYILCNGGQSGARAALKLLLNAGYSYDNIKVIQGGAGNEDVKAALVPVNVTGTVQTGDASTMMIYVGLMLVAAVAVIESKKRLATK